MSISPESLLTRLKNFDRWLPRRQAQAGRRMSPHTVRSSRPRRASLETSSSLDDALRITPLWQPSLDEVIENLSAGDLPEHAALLGCCEDNLPFLLDLANPAPGALLVTSDAGGGKSALLRSILDSASRMNPPERVAFDLIAAQPEEFRPIAGVPQCRSILPVEDIRVQDLIARLVRLTEKRKQTGPADPALILAIDDLASLLPFLSEEAFGALYWLIRHGPRYMVWTVASLPSAHLQQIEPRYLSAFRTRLFGYMRDERLASRLVNDGSIATRGLDKGRQFYVPYGGDWLRSWICEAQEAAQPVDESDDTDSELEEGEA